MAFFGDGLQQEDLRRFNASRGDSAFNTIWEALAILVALRLWRARLDDGDLFDIRSDSLGALGATLKGGSASVGLNMVVAEILLDEAEFSERLSILHHIPGVSNVWPDALSRLEAPVPKQVPRDLAQVERTACTPRTALFWQTARKARPRIVAQEKGNPPPSPTPHPTGP